MSGDTHGGWDFFVSYTQADRAWAEWIAWVLEEDGYRVLIQAWDFVPGSNWVAGMQAGARDTRRTIAVLSGAYLESMYGSAEWQAAWASDPQGADRRLLVVRVADCDRPGLLAGVTGFDLFGIGEAEARGRLRKMVSAAVAGRAKPSAIPGFPGGGRAVPDEPRFPGVRQDVAARQDAYTAGRDLTVIHNYGPDAGQARGPGLARRKVWGDVPVRNPSFTGREGLLAAVRGALLSGDRAVVQALHGMGGVGKTQLAVEYAHRFAASYHLVWWITAEDPGLIEDQFVALGERLGCVEHGDLLTDAARQAVLGELRYRDRWLLVFDNARSPEDLSAWLPGGAGHVLITSRSRGWAEVAVPVEVDVLARAESVAILQGRMPRLTDADADLVAQAMGDLPLGVVQAAGYMADTGTPATEYLDLLETRAGEVMDDGRPSSYPRSLAAVTQLAFDQLRCDNPASAVLAGVCAFLAPEPVLPEWFTRDPAQLPAPLADAASNTRTWRHTLAPIQAHALARIDQDGLRMHRLTQIVLRNYLSAGEGFASKATAEMILAASHPGKGKLPSSWTGWARLLPHVMVLNPETTTTPGLRQLAADAAWYMYLRGEWHSSRELASRLYLRWRDELGSDDLCTLAAAQIFGTVTRAFGETEKARELDEDILARRRRVLGDDHPDTLTSANILAISLRAVGEVEKARELGEDTLARRRRILGDDDPDTLISAGNLAGVLRVLGEVEKARELDEDTLARRRRLLGDDHPDTLTSANNLAAILRVLGEVEKARELDEDTLARRRRILGEDFVSTLTSAHNLATTLNMLGQHEKALALQQDTYERRHRVLGEDHPDTLASASSLVAIMETLGETEKAQELTGDISAKPGHIRLEGMRETKKFNTYLDVGGDEELEEELGQGTRSRATDLIAP